MGGDAWRAFHHLMPVWQGGLLYCLEAEYPRLRLYEYGIYQVRCRKPDLFATLTTTCGLSVTLTGGDMVAWLLPLEFYIAPALFAQTVEHLAEQILKIFGTAAWL